MQPLPTLSELAGSLAAGAVSSRELVERCLDRIHASGGEGGRAFIAVFAEEARAAAEGIDLLRKAGAAPSPFAGIPISVKDLFDIAGQVTRAGSTILADGAPAVSDAAAVARLKRAGFIVIGRTNMTEFAYSGLGINPHYGTPLGAWDRKRGHVPGGSSSGAAVSVADGMAHAGIGTDTGGSCRIPAAFNCLVGYKPTAARIPPDGMLPLSTTLDSIGAMARSVACCAALDAVMAGETAHDLDGSLRGIRLALPRNYVLDGMDGTIAGRLEAACAALRAAGAIVETIDVPEFDEIPSINGKGGFSAAESFAWHRRLLAEKAAGYDPRVRSRIETGAGQSAADYIGLIAVRRDLIARITARLRNHDGMIYPTTPITPPALSAIDSDESHARLNGLCLRNPSVVNLIDGCSISLPFGAPGEAPAGIMISAPGGRDRELFRMARSAERAFALHPGGQ
jgi:aspartyl-tRNA(Asn)/glutamyl-tRNA(Gln) amidotransferase subunit A